MIQINLVYCTTYRSKPFGLAHIKYDGAIEARRYENFHGLGFFSAEGMLHEGPFVATDATGYTRFFAKMENGRPAENHYMTYFFSRISRINV
jgi:hypothetical protein